MVARRAALGEARRAPRRALHAARRLRVLPRSASSRCCCSGTRASPYWKVGLGYALRRHRRRLRRHAGLALADRLGAGHAGRAWRRAPPTCSATSAARSCSRSSARCSPPGYAARVQRGDRRVAEQPTRSPTASRAQLTKSFAERRGDRAAVPAVRRARSSPRPSSRSSTATSGPTPRASSRSCSARRSSFFASRKDDEEKRCSPRYHAEDGAPDAPPAAAAAA